MDRNAILYRGSLKSCNYHCSYCPFSKRKTSQTELERDKEQWFSFLESLPDKAAALNIHALMVVPYGEALIHPWYWDGLARLSALDIMDAVGAQTNLSFSIRQSLTRFCQAGGNLHKLRLWATFHPEMISAEKFAEKCIQLNQKGISLCAGAVGAPENIRQIRRLRTLLPKEIYLWINKMDRRKEVHAKEIYTEAELSAFLEIDPYFIQELSWPRSAPAQCQGRLFVEGDGRLRACNIGPLLDKTWRQQKAPAPAPSCNRKNCSCYLAYGGQKDYMNQILFGPYPIFRIPRRAKAVFLDIEGTLIPQGHFTVPDRTALQLTALAREGAALFFATTLPYAVAVKRCRPILHLFRGGIFAGGAHLLWENGGKRREEFHFFPEDILPYLHAQEKGRRFRILIYENKKKVYKITLLRPKSQPWSEEEALEIWREIPEGYRIYFRHYAEGHCLQIVSAAASKPNGARVLCQWLGISPREATGAGDSMEDAAMMDFLNN